MDIHFTDTYPDSNKFQIQPLISTIEQFYSVSYSSDISPYNNKNSIWFLDFFASSMGYVLKFVKENINYIVNFKGKIVLYTLDDFGWDISHNILDKEIIERIDAFIYGNRFSDKCKFDIFEKSILIPRWCCNGKIWNEECTFKKIKRMFFRGMSTNIIRINGIKLLKETFSDELLDVGIYSTPEIDEGNHQFLSRSYYDDIRVDYLEMEDFRKLLGESLISICFPGTQSWTYRHVESMATSTAIVTCPVDGIYDNDWLYMDKVKDLFFYIKDDLSNLIDVCNYCLDDYNFCIEKGEEGFEIYKKYFELNPAGGYKNNVWEDIRSQFLNLNIEI